MDSECWWRLRSRGAETLRAWNFGQREVRSFAPLGGQECPSPHNLFLCGLRLVRARMRNGIRCPIFLPH